LQGRRLELIMESNDEREEDLDLAAREERAAAEEAAAIGGRRPDLGGVDTGEHAGEAMRPVYEAGGGEQDGFELAERDLVRNASHDDGTAYPERDAFTPERESDRSTAEYAESDDVEPRDQ
jgi:hypothetical protein